MWNSLRIFMSLGVVILATSNASSMSDEVQRWSPSYANSPGYTLFDSNMSPGQKRKLMVNLEGTRSLIGHSLRVRKSQGFQNNFGHALRIRNGRQFGNFGHTLRIKRGMGNRDSWNTRGYTLRVRRGEEQQPMDDQEYEQEPLDDNSYNHEQDEMELMNDLDYFEEPTDLDYDSEPRGSLGKRSGKGVRLHALRVKKSQQPNSLRWNKALGSMFNSWAKRKASLTHVLRVRKDHDSTNANPE